MRNRQQGDSEYPSPLAGEDRLGRSPSEEGGRRGRTQTSTEASGFDGAPSSDATALHARRPPSPLGLAPEWLSPARGERVRRCVGGDGSPS